MPPKKLTLVEAVTATRNKVLKQKKSKTVAYCNPQQTADYLLEFADSDPIKKVDGVCYIAHHLPIDLSKLALARENSEFGNGIFSPPLPKQKIALQKALIYLKEIGISVKECSKPVTSDFFKEDGNYLKVIFYSFSKKLGTAFGTSDDYSLGRTIDFTPKHPNAPTVHMLGIYSKNPSMVATILHEFGHIFGLEHFPPNFGYFPQSCGPEYDKSEKISRIQTIMEKIPCAVDGPVEDIRPGSIMFCNSPEAFSDDMQLSPGDKLAFKQQYDKLINGVSSHATSSGAKQKSKPQKVDLAINLSRESMCYILPENTCYSLPNLLEIAEGSALEGALTGSARGIANAIGKTLTRDTFKAQLISHALFYFSHLTWRTYDISQNNPEQANYKSFYQAGTETLGLAMTNLAASMAASMLHKIGNKLSECHWKVTGYTLQKVSGILNYASYAYEGVKTWVVSPIPIRTAAKLAVSTMFSMGSGYYAQRVTERAGNIIGHAYGFFRESKQSKLEPGLVRVTNNKSNFTL